MYVCMYACMYVCMYACMHVCMYACMHVCMYACHRNGHDNAVPPTHHPIHFMFDMRCVRGWGGDAKKTPATTATHPSIPPPCRTGRVYARGWGRERQVRYVCASANAPLRHSACRVIDGRHLTCLSRPWHAGPRVSMPWRVWLRATSGVIDI